MTELFQPAFPRSEYETRVARVQARMAARGLDALLVRDRAEVCYLTGMENAYLAAVYLVIVPIRGEPVLLASAFEMLNAACGVWWTDRVSFAVGADPIAAAAAALRSRGWDGGRIGIQPRVLTVAEHRQLLDRLPHARLVSADDLLAPLRVIKSEREIAYLREAGRLTTLGMEAALAEAAPGKRDNDLAATAYAAMVRVGSEYPCLEPIVSAGKRSGLPHAPFRRAVLAPGDAVLVEVGACVARYSAPLMRPIALAPVSKEVRAAATACRESLDALLARMRPGIAARDAAEAARAAWTPLCEELLWHGIYAYSVGLGFPPDWNDTPHCVTADADFVFAPGMCFHATTSLRKPCEFGTALSETVLITESGNEVLTGTPRELHVV